MTTRDTPEIKSITLKIMFYGKNLILSKLKSSSFNIPLEARTNTWSDVQYSSKKPHSGNTRDQTITLRSMNILTRIS